MKECNGDKVLNKFCVNFNTRESLSLSTTYIDNGDPITEKCHGIYLNQELTLQSGCDSASLNIFGFHITPESLRKIADELEFNYEKAVERKRMWYDSHR